MTERYRDFEPVDDDALDIDPEFAQQVEELFFEPEVSNCDLPETEPAVEAGGSWLSRIPLRKAIGTLAAGAVLVTGGLVASSKEATADTPPNTVAHHVYRTDGDGVWLHDGPGLHTPKEVIMPEGAEFDVQCFNPGGDLVNGNALWLTGLYNGRQGSTTDYYIDTHWKTTQDLKDQGIPECGQEQPQESSNPNPQPAAPLQGHEANPGNNDVLDRQRAVSWALANAQDQPPSNGSCTWFVSQALWQGGLRKTNEWTSAGAYGNKFKTALLGSELSGTYDAWNVPAFMNYMRKTYKNSTFRELSFSENAVPDAQPGDVIFYDWGKGEGISHATIITNIAGDQYPEVSEWSVQQDGTIPSPYVNRGWTWSKLATPKPNWLQKKYPEIKAYLLHIEVN